MSPRGNTVLSVGKQGKRFDAKRLGYQVSQVRGNGLYNGTCVGCYWHDPLFFNSEVSKHFTNNK